MDEDLIRQIIEKSASETAERTRGHFDAVAERLEGKIQLVAEGVAANREQVGLFQVEMQREFPEISNFEFRICSATRPIPAASRL